MFRRGDPTGHTSGKKYDGCGITNSRHISTGKVLVVTGARRGLGKAVAVAFTEAGADIAISDVVVEERELESTAREVHRLAGALSQLRQMLLRSLKSRI